MSGYSKSSDSVLLGSYRARSWLVVPADRPERIAKACEGPADVVIADLEDAVAPYSKAEARAVVIRSLSSDLPVMVRINGPNTEWFAQDLEVCKAPGLIGVVVPKVESANDLAFAATTAEGLPILPMIETALGLWNAHAIAQAPGVQRLVFGPLDFQLDLGMHGGTAEFAPFRSQLVLVSRVAKLLPPIDGPATDINDVTSLRADALRARHAGFGGKLCIHPKQLGIVNECFTPTAEEIAWARRVLAAATVARGAVTLLDGKMIDRPVVAQAEQIMQQVTPEKSRE